MANLAWAVALLLLAPFLAGVSDDVTRKAGRVETLIQQIQAAGPAARQDAPRKADLEESEINAYIAARLKKENEVLKRLQLKLLDGNLIRGNALLDLSGFSFLKVLPPSMNLQFKGLLETGDHRGRFKVESLMLGERPIQPEIIDVIIAGLASAYEMEPSSIHDWYELPYGINKIETRAGAATVYY